MVRSTTSTLVVKLITVALLDLFRAKTEEKRKKEEEKKQKEEEKKLKEEEKQKEEEEKVWLFCHMFLF